MDWRTIRFDWNRARAFLVTAEEGSLSAASRALGISQPTLGRQVSALEEELGVLLFDRLGRSLTPTPAGLELLEHVRLMGEAAGRVSLAASGQSQELEGSVCITASDMFSAYLLPDVLRTLKSRHPGITIEIEASNETRDLRRREADIAVRNVRPDQPDLVAKKVCDMAGHLYGARALLDPLGPRRDPSDVAHLEVIGFDHTPRLLEMLNAHGYAFPTDATRIVTASQFVMWELCKQGLGLSVNGAPIGDREPTVDRAVPDAAPIRFPVWLVSHQELHTSRRVRVVFDLLAEYFAALDPG